MALPLAALPNTPNSIALSENSLIVDLPASVELQPFESVYAKVRTRGSQWFSDVKIEEYVNLELTSSNSYRVSWL